MSHFPPFILGHWFLDGCSATAARIPYPSSLWTVCGHVTEFQPMGSEQKRHMDKYLNVSCYDFTCVHRFFDNPFIKMQPNSPPLKWMLYWLAFFFNFEKIERFLKFCSALQFSKGSHTWFHITPQQLFFLLPVSCPSPFPLPPRVIAICSLYLWVYYVFPKAQALPEIQSWQTISLPSPPPFKPLHSKRGKRQATDQIN